MRYLVILTVIALQGCAGAMLVAGVAGMATVEVTGKSASDHVISAVNGQDCKMSRKMQGRDVCQDQPDIEPVPVVADNKPIVIRVTSTSTVDDMEKIMSQRKSQK
jgi:hypothetical protein